MAGIVTAIDLRDEMSAKLDRIYRNVGIATMGIEKMGTAITGVSNKKISWQNIEGTARMEQQMDRVLQSAKRLTDMQDEITNRSYDTMVLNNNAAEDISNINDRLVELAMRAEALNNLSTDGATQGEINSINMALSATSTRLQTIFNLQNRINNALQAGDMAAVNQGWAQLNDLIQTANTQVDRTEELYGDIRTRIASANKELAVGIYKVEAEERAQKRLNTSIGTAEGEIRQNIQQQERFNNTLNTGSTAADRLSSKISAAAGAYISLQGVKASIDLSDSLVSTNARINLMAEGDESVEELSDKILNSAMRSRADYIAVAGQAARFALNAGHSFNGNDEIIAFLEGVNKQFAIGGASIAEQTGAMTQLTQAMASGVLRGEELNSILENAPAIARQIEKSMGWAEGSIKNYAEQGLVTAEIVKNGVLSNIEETNRQFEIIPMTFAQAMTLMKNKAVRALEPVLKRFNDFLNTEDATRMMDATVRVIAAGGYILLGILETGSKILPAIVENWDKVSYFISAAGGAWLPLQQPLRWPIFTPLRQKRRLWGWAVRLSGQASVV